MPVEVPKAVKVDLEGALIVVEGPKGRLECSPFEGIMISKEENTLVFTPTSEAKKIKAIHGLARAYVANMVKGVTDGFSKKLEIIGIGYRIKVSGKTLDLTIGKSHPVLYQLPEGLDVKVKDATHFEIIGIDKQLVGQAAANIRAFYPPEPYKGKGIRYEGEHVRRKTGKSVG
jgi:large subunit ribosomal protein L6